MLSVIRTGLDAATKEISVVSNNIANSASTGFKKAIQVSKINTQRMCLDDV